MFLLYFLIFAEEKEGFLSQSHRGAIVIERTYEPAFPQHPERCWADQQGMSLRDYFAAKAITALIERYECELPSVLAIEAYDIADAMLEARK